MINYTALIIDDNIEDSNLLELYIKKYCKEITIVFRATTVKEGIEVFLENRPNLIFLEVLFDNGDNIFNFLDNYDIGSSEAVITTNTKEYAYQAINKNNIIGYLLKPLKVESLINVISRALEKIEYKKLFLNKNNCNQNLIAVASQSKIDLIPIKEIISCSAEGKYTIFQTTKDISYTSSRNLGEYQELLNPNFFFRIHHKHIINIKHVNFIDKTEGYYCVLSNGVILPISKRKQEEFSRFIRLKF